jgi:hypothetical protein
MTRCLIGALLGVLATALLLLVTRRVLMWMTEPRVFEVEHSVIYVSVILGAGFGGVCGALTRKQGTS